jgi:hypothetical protein
LFCSYPQISTNSGLSWGQFLAYITKVRPSTGGSTLPIFLIDTHALTSRFKQGDRDGRRRAGEAPRPAVPGWQCDGATAAATQARERRRRRPPPRRGAPPALALPRSRRRRGRALGSSRYVFLGIICCPTSASSGLGSFPIDFDLNGLVSVFSSLCSGCCSCLGVGAWRGDRTGECSSTGQ